MDANKIIASLLTAAIVGLVSAVYGLNTNVAELSQQIAVMQERNLNTVKEWERRGKIVDQLAQSLTEQGERISRLEWKMAE